MTKTKGVWLDRKLRWRDHSKRITAKLETQQHALTRVTAYAWGLSLIRAREVYVKVIRSAITYEASACATPIAEGKLRGIAKYLATTQSHCLRAVAGTYKATPIRSLEKEVDTPPLDIYLNKRLVDFEMRLEGLGMA